MIDSHALVGSCAQVGARVHVSAAAQIGGVIEPIGALPVIIEDEVLIGGNTGIYEGAIIKTRAVIAAGTVLTGSTPVYDLVKGEIIRPTADRPLVVPEGAVVVPGARAVTVGQGRRVGPVARHAGHRQVSRLAHRHPHGARSVDPVDIVVAHAQPRRHRLDHRPRGRVRALARGLPARPRLAGRRAARRRHALQRPGDTCRTSRLAAPSTCRRVLHPLRLRPAVLSRAASTATGCSAAASCDAKGILAAQVAAAEQLRRDGETRVGLVFVVGEERGSDGARVANAALGIGRAVSDQRRADRQPPRPRDARHPAAQAARQRPRGAFVIPRARRVGDRQADRRADRAARRSRCRRIRCSAQTHYTVGLISGGVAPERRLAVGRGRGDVPDDERCGGGAEGGDAAREARRDRARARGAAGAR